MIEIERIAGLAFVQDLGRPGLARSGVPIGGALIPEALARSNTAVGNDRAMAAIECFGAITLRASSKCAVATDRDQACTLEPGDRFELEWDASVRARYLALSGGIDVPIVLGGRGTLISARIGGYQGRALKKGDRLASSVKTIEPQRAAEGRRDESSFSAIRLLRGPDLWPFAPIAEHALVHQRYTLSHRSDRTGTPLEGPAIPWNDRAPCQRTTPMIAGAIELPPSGLPIVLGPDHPTTGGYPVIAVLARVDFGRFHAIPLGGSARFQWISLDEARALDTVGW